MKSDLFLGEHYIAEFYDCQFKKLDDPVEIEQSFLQCAEICNATVICSKFHHFNPFGVSGVVVIAESHMTIHTWPEFKYAAVDVFTCTTKMKSQRCVEVLKDKLNCLNAQTKFLPRGSIHNLTITEEQLEESRQSFIHPKDREEDEKQKLVSDSWIYEDGDFMRVGIPFKKMLYHKNTKHQDIKIVESPTMGKTLLLDHEFSFCEKTEAIYHEIMVHPSLQILLQKGKKDLDILILGGNGGITRELLRYSEVKKIKIVQADADVIKSCQQFLPELTKSFNDSKVQIKIEDQLEFIENTNERWDLIISHNNSTNKRNLQLQNSFFDGCHKILTKDGILVCQGTSDTISPQKFINTNKCLKRIFGQNNVTVNFCHQPLCKSKNFSFHIGIKNEEGCDLKEFSKKRLSENAIEEFVEDQGLEYYNYDIHVSSFSMGSSMKRLLKEN